MYSPTRQFPWWERPPYECSHWSKPTSSTLFTFFTANKRHSSQTRLGVKIRILFAGKGHDSHFYLFILLRNSRFNSIHRHLSSSRPLLRKCFRLEAVKTLDMKSKRSGGGSRSAHVAVTGWFPLLALNAQDNWRETETGLAGFNQATRVARWITAGADSASQRSLYAVAAVEGARG